MAHYATAVRRVLAINATLPTGQKIRVISLSIGGMRGQAWGFDEIEAAVAEAGGRMCSVNRRAWRRRMVQVHGDGAGRDERSE
jgi:hypothetical protein